MFVLQSPLFLATSFEAQKDLSSKKETTLATQCPKKVKEKDVTVVKPSLPVSLHRKVDST